jgi:pimeloyl-ACP methyl ester carboxylesterase
MSIAVSASEAPLTGAGPNLTGPVLTQTARGQLEWAGLGDGPAVLCVHGAMGGWDQGLLLARTLGPPGFRYLAVSRPGYLGTELAAGRSPEEQADLFAALLDQLGIADAAVMAVSGGGPSAIQFALRHRDRCRGLVLVSTCAGRIDVPIPFAFTILKWMAGWPWLLARQRRAIDRDPDRAVRRSIPDPLLRARTLQDPEAGPLLLALQRSTLDRMALRLAGTENDIAITRSPLDWALEDVAVPALVIHGTADRVVPYPQHAVPLATRIPGAELLTVEGGDHVSIFTHHDACKARAVRFLSDLEPAAARKVEG